MSLKIKFSGSQHSLFNHETWLDLFYRGSEAPIGASLNIKCESTYKELSDSRK